jgi:hypothetical protein
MKGLFVAILSIASISLVYHVKGRLAKWGQQQDELERKVKNIRALKSYLGGPNNSTLEDRKSTWLANLFKTEPSGDVMETAIAMRIFKSLYLKRQSENLSEIDQDTYDSLTQRLFPWLMANKTIDDLRNDAIVQRGAVIAAGKKYLPLAVHLIRTLRMLNFTLPVEVFHLGPADLDERSVQFLNEMPGVRAVDVGTIFNMTILELKGWDIKPFAILGSSFKEVILLDADAIMMKHPDVLFSSEEYRNTGTVFFVDRFFKTTKHDFAKWFEQIIPGPLTQKLRDTPMNLGESDYYQESGVVLIDKTRRFTGLLAACLLNAKKEKEKIHAKTHGDKETFWLGFEISEDPYEFLDKHAGTVGVAGVETKTARILQCGKLAHFDKKGELLWFNGGIVDKKSELNSSISKFLHMSNAGKWSLNCLIVSTVQVLPDPQKMLLARMKELWDPEPIKDSK